MRFRNSEIQEHWSYRFAGRVSNESSIERTRESKNMKVKTRVYVKENARDREREMVIVVSSKHEI